MLDWMNRTPQKTEDELRYDELSELYFKKFGVPWIEKIGFSKSMKETLKEIQDCIEHEKKQTVPEYKDGLIY